MRLLRIARRAALVAGAFQLAPPVQALVVPAPVQPPAEACDVDLSRFLLPPAELRDCKDEHCGRLIPLLRHAAQTHDAQEILVRAAFESYVTRHRRELDPAYIVLPALPQALADLAVTGRAAYDSFRSLAPTVETLVEPLRQRLLSRFPTHAPVASDMRDTLEQALARAYQVAWVLRGPTPYRTAHRDGLGWIAVEGEDDPPHRPVNVPSAPFPQFDLTVHVGALDVVTRAMVASRSITDDHPVDVHTVPPERGLPLIIGDVVLFIHGHSSSVEEALPLAGPLLEQAAARGRPVTLISMDLPSNGYSSRLEHTTVQSVRGGRLGWNVGYPILDFLEDSVIAFVDALEAQQPGIKAQIVGVIGGSLGGNLTLRLGRRDPAVYPWLRNLVSWSPASSWNSFARALPFATAEPGRTYDFAKYQAVNYTFDAMGAEERSDGSRFDTLHRLFYDKVLLIDVGRIAQSDHWYSPSWPCREAERVASHRSLYEIYDATFRRWHFRVAHEQLIFSHWDSDNPDPDVDPDPRIDAASGPARYTLIRSRLLLATGSDDRVIPEYIYDNTVPLAKAMTMVDGEALFVLGTGHSIPTEKPAFFADRILTFLFQTPAPPCPSFLVPPTC